MSDERHGGATAAGGSRRAWDLVRRAGRGALKWSRRVADKFPLTPLGILLVVAAALAAWYLGRKHQDVVLYVSGLGAIGVVLVSMVMVMATTVAVAFGHHDLPPLPPARMEAGQRLTTGFSLPALGWLPLVSVRWEWEWPTAVRVEAALRKGRLVEEVIFGERGEHLVTLRRVVVEDVLGLARLAFISRQSTPRTVHPALGRPLASPLLEAFSGGDAISHPAGPPAGDLVDMRRYAVGDPMKRILWKVYARTRNLMVRLPEHAISPTRRTLAYLVAGEGDEAAAGVARLAVESEALGPEWRFSADQPEGAATTESHDAADPRAALALIVRSRAARLVAGDGLQPFLERQAAWGGRCVIFAPPRFGRWLAAVERQARQRPGQIEIVLGVDGLRGQAAPDRWRRLFLVDDTDDLAETRAVADEVDRMARRLTALGAAVTVVDRPTGRLYGRTARRRRA